MTRQNRQSAIRTLVQASRLTHPCQDIAQRGGRGHGGAKREYVIYEITDQMQPIVGMETLMRITVLELLGGTHV